jgi:hypothetical protein
MLPKKESSLKREREGKGILNMSKTEDFDSVIPHKRKRLKFV